MPQTNFSLPFPFLPILTLDLIACHKGNSFNRYHIIMKHIRLILAMMFVTTACGHGAPLGLCVYADSPATPAKDAQVFEFRTYERIGDGFRCFPVQEGGALVVTNYRLRGIILYPQKISGYDPKLPDILEKLKGYIVQYPTTQPFLKPWIDKMTGAIESASKATTERASLPIIKIGKNDLGGSLI